MSARPRKMQCPLVSLEGVVLERGRRLLHRIDWHLRERELWAVVGPNGAGKSLLLRTLAGEFPVSVGEVCYAFPSQTRSRRDPSESIRRVAFETQGELLDGAAGYAQSRWHALEDADVMRGRELLGGARRSARGRHLIRALGLEALLERRVTELSNGERRKLLLAREAARGPSMLLLDNPFSGLDARSRRTLGATVRQLHRGGLPVVIATAREDEILPAVTHILLLDRGRAVVAGKRSAVVVDERFQRAMRVSERRGTGGRPSARAARPTHQAAEDAVVELAGVDLRYGSTHVLRGIDWVVRRGERWVVLGPNGAGKSALLSLVLADNPQAYAHDVSLFGRRRGSGETIWEVRRRIGCVSPELHLFHHSGGTALEAVCSGFHDSIGLYRRAARSEVEAAFRCMRRLAIFRCRERRFAQLSEGERQLVLLARALVKEPELLILDEPCQGLDAHHRRRFLELLERMLRRRDMTLIHVTHDLDEISPAATHGLVLRRGRKALQGEVNDVLRTYARAKR